MNLVRQSLMSLFACCAMFTANQGRGADSYSLDMSHTSIIFGVSHMNFSYTYGRFNKAQGNFSWDNANPAASMFVLAIETASIDTNDAKRDAHLRNADFFNANQFPQIVFQSTAVKSKGGDSYDVVGNLTMHGVTKQVTLPLKKLGEGQGPGGQYRCGFFCQTTLKRSDFGMNNMIPNIGDQIAVTVSFEGTRQATSGAGSATTGSGNAAAGSGAATAPAASESPTE